MGIEAALIGGGAALLGGAMSSSAQRRAAQTSADAQVQAAQIAAEASKFRPVGMTTNFGRSNFTLDENGNLVSAGYTLDPRLQALQSGLMGGYGNYLQQAQNVNTAPLTAGAQSLFGLGQQLLPTSVSREASPEALALSQQYQRASQGLIPTDFTTQASPEAQAYANQLRGLSSQVLPTSYDTTAAAQRYTEQQQNLLAPQREQQLAGIRNRLFQTGRSGLATGGTTTGLQATNPEMAAYYNSLAQQNAAITANAEQQARANLASDISLGQQLGGTALTAQTNAEQLARQNMLQNLGLGLGFGTQGLGTTTAAEDLARARLAQDIGLGGGLFGTAAGLQGQGYGLQSAAYGPLSTALGISGAVEEQGMQPFTLGTNLGGRTTQANQYGAGLMNTAAQNAAALNYAANRTSPLGAALQGLGSNQQFTSGVGSNLGNWFSNVLNTNSTASPFFNTGANVFSPSYFGGTSFGE